MSSIKVDTIATRTGSGNITLSNTIDLNGNELILDVDGDTSLTADTDDQIDIRIGGTDVGTLTQDAGKLTINSTGSNLAFAVGGTVELNTDGTQFYPNTDDSHNLGTSSLRFKDLYLSSGVFLGGTGAANKLDDYEEGTWTPVFQNDGSTSYTVQAGKYRKIGDVVIATFHLDINTGNAIGGNHLVIENLPFTVANSANQYGNCSGFHCNLWATSSKPDNGLASPGTTILYFYRSEGQTGAAIVTGNDIGTGNLLGHVIFFVS